MRTLLFAIKVTLQIIKCLKCVYKAECPHSIFNSYRGKEFEIKIVPIEKKGEE